FLTQQTPFFFFALALTLQEGRSSVKHVHELTKLYDKVWDFLKHICDIIMILMLEKIDLPSILFDWYFLQFKI
ncbi:MAG: hypothetical protein ACPGLV_19610, partial [Bacteroidia bacterium]